VSNFWSGHGDKKIADLGHKYVKGLGGGPHIPTQLFREHLPDTVIKKICFRDGTVRIDQSRGSRTDNFLL